MKEPIHVISLGAGVQSSTLAMMASLGEMDHLPMPVAAVFADTQGEPKSVYKLLDWLETQVAFPIIRATAGNLAEDSTRLRVSKKSGNTYLKPSLPVYLIQEDGSRGMPRRQCTMDYKIVVVRREIKKLLRKHGSGHAIQWIGISIDEAHRQKASRDNKITNIWPLISKGISRSDCLTWWRDRGLPTPGRSSCVYCPYHSDKEWSLLKKNSPEEFDDAVEYERKLRSSVQASTAMKAKDVFLHRSCVPLDQVQFNEASTVEPIANECEGMCGV